MEHTSPSDQAKDQPYNDLSDFDNSAEPQGVMAHNAADSDGDDQYELEQSSEQNQSLITSNYDFAGQVEPHEIVRVVGNDGADIDPLYSRNQFATRHHFLNQIKQGHLYQDGLEFEKVIRYAHAIAASGNVYSIAGHASGGLDASEIGVFRQEGSKMNSRVKEAREVAGIAKTYDDPYKDRFLEVEAGKLSSTKHNELPGLDTGDLPYDVVLYDDDGKPDDYRFIYPESRSIPKYMDQIAALGQAILTDLNSNPVDRTATLELIARQYQYGVAARPFQQINNSLFMNLANTQIKLLGYNGIAHGILDHAAQRLGPKAFSKYFIDCVLQASPQ